MTKPPVYRSLHAGPVGLAALLSLLIALWLVPVPVQASAGTAQHHTRKLPWASPHKTACTVQNFDVTVLKEDQMTDPKHATPGCSHTVAIGFAPIDSAIDVSVCKPGEIDCQTHTLTKHGDYAAYFTNAPDTLMFCWKLHDPQANEYGSMLTIYF